MDEQFEFLDTNRLLTADEVSRILIYSRSNAYRLMRKQNIITVHFGGARRVWLNDLKKFIEDEKMSSKKKKKY
jgi:predicted DNA-binding transcriptional regulator AlpA